jgi:LDH2 family malate/lactate/ureidoglycolate dehydrogenase
VPIDGHSLASDIPRFDREHLTAFATSAFVSAGLNEPDARIAANQLVIADLQGVESHGLARLSGYIDRLRTNRIDPTAELKVDRETPSTVAFNANNGLGLLMGPKAMSRVVEKAQDTGICMGTVRESNHFGIVGTYVRQATSVGLGGMAMTNAAAIVVPTFGTEPRLGTNPIALGVPTRRGYPLVIDMSTSTVAWGKIEIARRANLPIPPGWAVDEAGQATTDPKSVRGLTPLGGTSAMSSHKGYGLGLMVDVFCGPLAANPASTGITSATRGGAGSSRTGHAFMAWRIDAFRDEDEFHDDLDRVIAEFMATPVLPDAPVDHVVIPGDPEYEAESRNTDLGIPIRQEVLAELEAMCEIAGIPFIL